MRLCLHNFPHVVFISETWFWENSAPEIANHQIFKRDREKRGGGVAIYIRSDLVSYDIVNEKLNSGKIEQIWSEIKGGEKSILVGCIYRAPNKSVENMKEITEVLREAKMLIETKKFQHF